MKTLRIGFIPLIDAAVPIAAAECGFAGREGLQLELVREVSWANIRDKLISEIFDAAHMLAPLAVATSLGLGHVKMPLTVPFALNANGNAITVSAALYREIASHLGHDPAGASESAAAMGAIIARRRKAGAEPLTFGVVFPFSIHAILIRHWLRLGGVDLSRDVQFVVVPPPFMVKTLSEGAIQGYCVGEPWNSRAVESGAGCIVAFGSEINRAAPDKVLTMRENLAMDDPETVAALTRACAGAAAWCEDAGNRENLANILAGAQYLNVAPRTILNALNGTLAVAPTQKRAAADFLRFGGPAINRPDPRRAFWIYAELMGGLQRPLRPEEADLAARVYRADLYDAALGAKQSEPPADPIGLVFGPDFTGGDWRSYAAAIR